VRKQRSMQVVFSPFICDALQPALWSNPQTELKVTEKRQTMNAMISVREKRARGRLKNDGLLRNDLFSYLLPSPCCVQIVTPIKMDGFMLCDSASLQIKVKTLTGKEIEIDIEQEDQVLLFVASTSCC
jgi:hypothetical protein